MVAVSTTAACAVDESSACVASTESALYSAESDPASLQLGRAERAAIVSIVAEGYSGPDLCTGTFVSKGFVLTAAHCELPRSMEVVVGDDIAQAQAVRLSVLRRQRHAELDLMLLEVEPPGSVAPIQPIPVLQAEADLPDPGEFVELAGFGRTETGEIGKLGFVSERVVAVDERTITVDGAGLSGACNGDSGRTAVLAELRVRSESRGRAQRGLTGLHGHRRVRTPRYSVDWRSCGGWLQ